MSYEKERDEVIEWLKHPNELAKAPSKIEFVKEFTDEEDCKCLIFRFKAGMLSPWLLAIHSDCGIFSEQEKYDEKRDVEQAKALMEYLKTYWKNVERNEEEKEERKEKAKGFGAFVLLENPGFDVKLFMKKYEEEWGEALDGYVEPEKEGDTVDAQILTTKDGFRIIMGYMEFRVPGNEAEDNASYNFMWKEAVETTAKHKAHMVVSVSDKDRIKEAAMFYGRAMVTICQMENVLGIYSNGVVYQPKMFVGVKKAMLEGSLPLPVLVWCGICQGSQHGLSTWTEGMKNFGFDEMEIENLDKQPSEVYGFMLLLVEYCISNDISFHDGETVGLAAGLQVRIKKSKGYNVDEDGETLKILLNG